MGLTDEITETIWAHHRDICRLSDEMDVGYQRVVRRIIEFVADASAESSRRSGSLSLRVLDSDERPSGGEAEMTVEEAEDEREREEVDLVDIGDLSSGGNGTVDFEDAVLAGGLVERENQT